jgi:Zn-dependent protease
MAGVVPLTPEAAKHLSVYRDNFNLQLVPPLLLSALGVNTPMYAPAGWYTHVLLGDAYVVPLRLAGYMVSLNLLVALFNSLPVRILDGGLAFQSLLKSRIGDRGGPYSREVCDRGHSVHDRVHGSHRKGLTCPTKP